MASCAPTYYKPKTINVPLLETKNDAQISAHINEGINIQGAYAVSDNIGLTIDFFDFNNKVKTENSNGSKSRSKYTYRSAELGIGYFKNLNNRLYFEVYGIGGIGKLSKFSNAQPTEYYEPAFGQISSNYTLLGIQPSFGVKWKYLELAYSMRLLRTNFYNTEGNYTWNGKSEVDYLNNKNYQDIIEHGFTVRAGLKNVKLQLQLVKSNETGMRSIRRVDDNQRNPFDGGTLSLGLTYNFNTNRN